MRNSTLAGAGLAAPVLASACGLAQAQTRVNYGRIATQSQASEFAVLIDRTQTIRMITDQAGPRVGDTDKAFDRACRRVRMVCQD